MERKWNHQTLLRNLSHKIKRIIEKTLPQAGVDQLFRLPLTILSNDLGPTIHFVFNQIESKLSISDPVSYTHLTLPTIYSV